MDKKDLKNLEDALKRSPNNIGLRLNYALKLYKFKEYDLAEKNYQMVLKDHPENMKAKQGLIEVYFAKNNFSAVIVIAEEIVQKNMASEKILELYAKSLLRQNNLSDAQEVYQKLINRNPFFFDEELDSALDNMDEYVYHDNEGFEYEEDDEEDFGMGGEEFGDFMIDNLLNMSEHLFLEERKFHFEHIIGMEDVKSVLKYKLNFITRDVALREAYSIKNTGGILLYGPYGCGKTHIVKSIPYEFDCKVLPFEMFRLTDLWSFNKEGMMHYFFNFARANMPCVLFFDEVDGLAVDRNKITNHADRSAVSKLLLEMDNVRENNHELMVIASTNAPWQLDTAMLRYGRFDQNIFVAPPDEKNRKSFINQKLSKIKNKVGKVDDIVAGSHLYTYAEIEQIFDLATMTMLNEHDADKLPDMTMHHLMHAVEWITPSIYSWVDLFKQHSTSHFQTTSIFKTVNTFIEKNGL
jgi:SpoVK/Ycf46/Vps4 family AAA+-type ATPase